MVSTIGFNLHRLYCLCTKNITVSILHASDECSTKNEIPSTHACCKKVKTKCCSASKSNKTNKKCTQEEIVYLHLDSPFSSNEIQSFVDLQFEIDKSLATVALPNFHLQSYYFPFRYSEIKKAPPLIPFLEWKTNAKKLSTLQTYRC